LFRSTLADFQNATATDLNSVSTDPAFPAFDDLTTCNDTIDNASIADSLVIDDNNGILRSPVSPDIGAFEFDGVNNFSIGVDSAICYNDTIVLGNPYSQSSWVWNNGFTTPSIGVNAPGLYIAQFNNSCCIGLGEKQITYKPIPTELFSSAISYLTGDVSNSSIGADKYLRTFGYGDSSSLENPLQI